MINGRYVVEAKKPLYIYKGVAGKAPYEISKNQIRVTLVKGVLGIPEDQRQTVKALGLTKIRTSNVINDSPALQGMLFKVKHLIKVEEVK